MKTELINNLVTEFPRLFENMKPEIWTEDGWFELIRKLCLKLIELERVSGIRISVLQVKEKFAELRFYVSVDTSGLKDGLNAELWSEIIMAVIQAATEKSKHVCERCGAHGERRDIIRSPNSSPYFMTLCKNHFAEQLQKCEH